MQVEERADAGGSANAARAADDPWVVLGVRPEASPEEIQRAYLARVKEFPPDRAPAEFERVRDAHREVKDPRARLARLWFKAPADPPFVSLLEGRGDQRRHTGPGPWLEAIKEG